MNNNLLEAVFVTAWTRTLSSIFTGHTRNFCFLWRKRKHNVQCQRKTNVATTITTEDTDRVNSTEHTSEMTASTNNKTTTLVISDETKTVSVANPTTKITSVITDRVNSMNWDNSDQRQQQQPTASEHHTGWSDRSE